VAAAARKLGKPFLGPAGLQVAVLVRETDDRVGVADVDVLRVRAAGIEGDAEGQHQALGKDRNLLWLAVGGDAAKDPDYAGSALGQKDVAVGSGAQLARVVETRGVQLDLEARGRLGPGVCRAWRHRRSVVYGLLRIGRGKIGCSQMTPDSGRLMGRIGKCRFSCQDLLFVLTSHGKRHGANGAGQEKRKASQFRPPGKEISCVVSSSLVRNFLMVLGHTSAGRGDGSDPLGAT
jgi:hypothetical protein